MRRATTAGILAAASATAVAAVVLAVGSGETSLPPADVRSVALIAHIGLHQATRVTSREQCSAELVGPPRHRFIDNTIPSMAEAFRFGATAVELDIHPTTDGHLVVFHDWQLDCRTDGTGTTHERSLAYLKSLDVGYGYTADSGRTFPLRGSGVGLMPTLPEVLETFPEGTFVVNQKDQFNQTSELLAQVITSLPETRRSQVFYWGPPEPFEYLRRLAPHVQRMLPTVAEARHCARRILVTVGFSSLPAACRDVGGIALPARFVVPRPGWRHWVMRRVALQAVRRAVTAGEPVYVINVDDAVALRTVLSLPVTGIMTDRIDVVGPLFVDARTASVSAAPLPYNH